MRSAFSPQRKTDHESMILRNSTSNQVSTVRRNSSTSGVIVEEDLINTSQEVEPELESILDLD